MKARLATIVLIIGVSFGLISLLPKLRNYHLPNNQQGYSPRQPIAFSHRQHCGQLQISCFYCHSGAEKGRYAGIPSTNVCMNCHQMVTASWNTLKAGNENKKNKEKTSAPLVSPELRKLFDSWGWDENLKRTKEPHSIEWVRIHKLPDYVYFNHQAHVKAGVNCQECHGAVENMDRVRQVESLSMGWCVNCHRKCNLEGIGGQKVKASTDCAVCHY